MQPQGEAIRAERPEQRGALTVAQRPRRSEWSRAWRRFRRYRPALFGLSVIGVLIVIASLSIAGVILAESALSFLGLGTQPPQASWGSILSAGRTYIRTYPHICIAPGVLITITVLAFNLLGDGLRDALDPRMKI